jgi:hypothetical protein
MRTPQKNQFLLVITLLLTYSFIMACIFTSLPTSSNGSSNKATGKSTPIASTGQPALATSPVQAGQSTPGIGVIPPAAGPDPLDHLLAMNSIKISLKTSDSDGTTRQVDAEIDQAGNIHVKYDLPVTMPTPAITPLPKEFEPVTQPDTHEVFSINGKVYQSNDQKPDWQKTAQPADYRQALSQELHGMDGPALYLDLLPEGSIQDTGKDNVGGFAAEKYSVNGKVAGQPISGTIWIEPQADALVQADLTVPAPLFNSTSGQSNSGTIRIFLTAQKADVPPITLPAVQATIQP